MAKHSQPQVRTIHWSIASSPLGDWLVAGTDRGVCLLYLDVERGRQELPAWRDRWEVGAEVREGTRGLETALRELRAYGQGKLRRFTTKLDLRGTDFQLRDWAGLLDIPFGEVWTYKRLAEHLGASGSYRAVGGANGKNPVPVIVPCHRVVACGGGLGGYTGGLHHKERLLVHEGALLPGQV